MAKYKVLSTKKLEPSLIEKARANSIEILEQEFISIKPIPDRELPQKLIDLAKAGVIHVVFTSQNAVFALDQMLQAGDRPEAFDWKVFCLSGKTKEAVAQAKDFKADLLGVADNSMMLAQKIIDKHIKEVIFFCGNKRRDELPGSLKDAGITIHEFVVYETVGSPSISHQDLDAVLFFSPSAVQSFFSVNRLKKDTVCFAIGKTTANSVTAFTGNKIIVSESPSQDEMLAAVNFYFQNINCYE